MAVARIDGTNLHSVAVNDVWSMVGEPGYIWLDAAGAIECRPTPADAWQPLNSGGAPIQLAAGGNPITGTPIEVRITGAATRIVVQGLMG